MKKKVTLPLYHIIGINPIKQMGGHGFIINLSKEWKEEISRSNINQEQINNFIENRGRAWLDVCGYDAKTKYGNKEEYLYKSRDIRVTWGEWGPDHITVPGDACGLDIARSVGSFIDGMSLCPHNVDAMRQAYLLLIVFTNIADQIVLDIQLRSHK